MTQTPKHKKVISVGAFLSTAAAFMIVTSSLNTQAWGDAKPSIVGEDETPTPTATATVVPTTTGHVPLCTPPSSQIQILLFGDAYTVGVYDADPREGVYGSQQGAYRGYLEQRLTKDGFNFDFTGSKKKKGFEGPKDIDHYGWYGLSLGRLASEGIVNMAFFEEQYKRPHIVLFSAGIIDALSNNSEGDMTQSMNTLVDGTMSRMNNPIMLMATMPPIKDPRTKIQQSRLAYNQATKNVVAQQTAKGRKIYLVDVAAVLTSSNSEDNFLPSESEYETMGALFHQGICDALGKPAVTATPTATATPAATPTPTAGPVYMGVILKDVFDPTLVTPSATPTATPPAGAANCAADPNASIAPNSPVKIASVDKVTEVVTLQNVSASNVDVTGWRICSITGNQLHATLNGSIAASASLQVVRQAASEIWLNSSKDDAALYDNQGRLISYLTN